MTLPEQTRRLPSTAFGIPDPPATPAYAYVVERLPASMPTDVAGRLAIVDYGNGPDLPCTIAVMPDDVEDAIGTPAAVKQLSRLAAGDQSHRALGRLLAAFLDQALPRNRAEVVEDLPVVREARAALAAGNRTGLYDPARPAAYFGTEGLPWETS